MCCVIHQCGSTAQSRAIRRHPCGAIGRGQGRDGIAIYTLEPADADGPTAADVSTAQRSSCSSEDFSAILAAYYELRSGAISSKASSGRGVTSLIALGGSSQGIMRLYRRGGMLSRFVGQTFVAGGEPRPIRELAVLGHLHAAGAAVAEPCAAVVRRALGGWFYEGALITRYLPNAINLLEIVQKLDSSQLGTLCRKIGAEAGRNLQLGVYQPDLHLGNVLVEPESRAPILIDFDKATWNQQKPEAMLNDASVKSLVDRWRRSAQKHLNAAAREVAEAFEQGLQGERR